MVATKTPIQMTMPSTFIDDIPNLPEVLKHAILHNKGRQYYGNIVFYCKLPNAIYCEWHYSPKSKSIFLIVQGEVGSLGEELSQIYHNDKLVMSQMQSMGEVLEDRCYNLDSQYLDHLPGRDGAYWVAGRIPELCWIDQKEYNADNIRAMIN